MHPVVVYDEPPGPQLTGGTVVSLTAQYDGKCSTRPPGIAKAGPSIRVTGEGLRSSKPQSNEKKDILILTVK